LILFDLLVEFTDIVMTHKCMLGIQRRTERASRKTLSGPVRQDKPVSRSRHLGKRMGQVIRT
jgi:hypothetical protein